MRKSYLGVIETKINNEWNATDSITGVQNLDKAVCISHDANAPDVIFSLVMGR